MQDMCLRSARELAGLIRTREVTAVEVMQAHLDRIERVNPAVNAIVTLDAEGALTRAAAADRDLAEGKRVGPLHGLPIAHKDTHFTAGMLTTFGCRLFADHIPERDELIITRIRNAGAIPIGKTNVPEMAAGSHTYNDLFGVTRNPYDLSRSAGGSSGGAAAALATGMHPIADGSDMGGSLRNPASFCNVVGLRPTPGRVPTVPAAMPWTTMAVQGPMARSVDDLALLLSCIAGPDPRSPICLDEDPAVLDRPWPDNLGGLRVAWAPDLGGAVPVEKQVREVLGRAPAVFERLGWNVTEDCIDFGGADRAFRALRAWQFAGMFGDLVDDHPDVFKDDFRWNVRVGQQLSGNELAWAEKEHGRLHAAAAEFFDRYDVLVTTVSQVAPFDTDLTYPDLVEDVPQTTYLDWMRSACHVTMLGAPALSVPAGFTGTGLPVGLQIITRPRADRLALEVGRLFERETGYGARRPTVLVAAEPTAGSVG